MSTFDASKNLLNIQPIISAKEQICLVKQWQELSDKRALDKLTLSNMKAVAKEAYRLSRFNVNISYDDLLQEGVAGLLKAASLFDPDKGVGFLTYATWWVRANMRRHVMDNRSSVRLGTTRDDRIIFSGFSKAREQAEKEGYSGELKIERMAKILGVKKEAMRRMIISLSGFDTRLDAPVSKESPDVLKVDLFEDPSLLEEKIIDSNEMDNYSEAIEHALSLLPDAEKEIIISRYFSGVPKTLRDLASEMKISREWVRQLETKALDKIRRTLAREYNIRE